ncbi:hypothetical protein Slin15195_G043820 [Septoria linicola]|uniref:Uncharacterized protein n=1 Tax=Septoria linicola TaxID=215465 RepID=A0A9Q9EJ73_9PEZI|nr:hypothetical protein Slin14017_G047340 [Septoria linicola]USW51063.1 hypothetical protein Slin15195_G043820 [Septoria linicola]
MSAIKVMSFADDFANPLGLHPPSPTYARNSEGRVDSIINSYAMERSPTEKWIDESCVGSYIDDRCPTEWEHPLSPCTPQSAQSYDWPDPGLNLRPIDDLNITDESRIIPSNVAARFATRELNGLRSDSLTALPQSPVDDTASPLKRKKLDATLLRKLFRATIDEKRRVDEARRQTTQDVNAKVTAKAGAEARSRRAAEQSAANTLDDNEVLRGIRQSLDEQNQSTGSEQRLPVSETKSEDAKPRGSQDSQRARLSIDRPSSRASNIKSSFDKSRLARITGKSGEDAASDMPLRLPRFSSMSMPSKIRALSTTREEGQVKDSGKRSIDLTSARLNKPVARDARTKKRESGIVELQNFLRDTGPAQSDSPTLGKPKTGKLSKQRAKDKHKNKAAHYEQRRKKSAAAAAETLLSPVEPPVPHWPGTSQVSSVHALEIGLGVVTEEPVSMGSSLSKRMNDRARMQATVESASSRASSGMLLAESAGTSAVQYSRGASVDIPRTLSRPRLSRRATSRPSSSYRFPTMTEPEEPVTEKEPSINSIEQIEQAWALPAPLRTTSREVSASFHGMEEIGQAVTQPILPVKRKTSSRHPMPKLALKIPAPGDWEEVSYAQSVVFQTLTPVSASRVIIPKSAVAKSPSVPDFPPLPEGFAIKKDYSRCADREDLSDAEDTQDDADDVSTPADKPPMERKDSKTPSVEPSPVADSKWDQPPSQKSNSNWFRDYTSPTLHAFEFQAADANAAKSVPLKTPQAASEQIQGVVAGRVEAAHEQRSLKLAAAKQVMRAPRSPGPPSARAGSRATTSLGFREEDNDWTPVIGARDTSRPRQTSERPKTSTGRNSRSPSRSRSIFSDRRSSAVSGGTFEELGLGVTTGGEPKSDAWAAASARSTKVPIKGMSFRSGPSSRTTSRPASRAQSRAPSVRSPMSPQQEWGASNFMPDVPSAQASQTRTQVNGQGVESWPEYQSPDRTSKASAPDQTLRRPSLTSTHRSQKSQGASLLSVHSRKSSAASHHSSTTSYPRSVHAESERSYDNHSRLSQYSSLGKQLDGSSVPPLPDSPSPIQSDEPKKRPVTQATVFAGKGWISPHPLSRSPTDLASPPQSKIVLPSDAFPQGATMTYDEWKQIQEAGLRLRHNHSITESSRTHHGVYQEERFRHAAWEGRGPQNERPPMQSGSNESARSSTSNKVSTLSSLREADAQDSQQGVSFVTGSAKSSRHQRSNSA